MEADQSTPKPSRDSALLSRWLPRSEVLSPWTVFLPGLVVVTVALGLGQNTGFVASFWLSAASVAVMALGLWAAARVPIALPHWAVVSVSPVLFVGLGVVQQQVFSQLGSLARMPEVTVAYSWLTGVTIWLVLSYPGWFIAGHLARIRRQRRRITELNFSLEAMSRYQRNRIRAQLRSLLRELASRLDRVVQEMTIESSGADHATARTMPHRDELTDQLVDGIEHRLYQAVAAKRKTSRLPLWSRVEAAHPIVVPVALVTTLGALSSQQRGASIGAMVLVVLLVGITHAALRFVGRKMQPSATRGAAIALGSIVVGVLASAVLSHPLVMGELVAPAVLWAITVGSILLGTIVSTWVNSVEQRQHDARALVLEQVRECVQLAIRHDTLSSTNARTLYSATLGTLIFASVDLTNTRGKPETREAALDTMASRIVTEINGRVSQLEPLPEEHIRLVAAVWQSAAEVTVAFRQQVFSRFSWADESIRVLQRALGELVIDAAVTASGPIVLVVEERDRELVATLRYPGELGFAPKGATVAARGELTLEHLVEATPITKTPLRPVEPVFAS